MSELLNICIDLAKMGRKPGNHLDAKGYEMLEKRFKERTQVHRTRAQLKNKFDKIHEDWQL